MIQKLNIIGGIVQDKHIDGIPLKLQIVEPSGKPNVRTLIKMPALIGITNHNTANTAPTAGDEAHAKWLQGVENADKEYVSAHFFVDADSITQCVPLDEVCYHAGDGKGDGNYKTIAVEICENGDNDKSIDNAVMLNAALMLTFPRVLIYKHQDWSGKYCPRILLNRGMWDEFVQRIHDIVNEARKPDPFEADRFWAMEHGISDGRDPDRPVLRKELWAMLHRMSK
jgi:N-acetylmuramoyl-L-alanine amidase